MVSRKIFRFSAITVTHQKHIMDIVRMKIKKFGSYPKKQKFSPKPATRGGYTNFFNKESEVPLTGEIHGLKAAKGEERLARALNKKIGAGTVRSFFFRSSPGLAKGQPGWKELDFEISTFFGTS